MEMNPYEILDIPKDSTAAQIKKAYRELAKKYHPDKIAQVSGANDVFKEDMQAKMSEISSAYAVLSDPESRKKYDETGKIETAVSFESQVDGWINRVLTQALQDKDIKANNLVRKCETIFKDEIKKIKDAIDGMSKYKESLIDIHEIKCKKVSSDSEIRQKRKAQFEYILNQSISKINEDIEKFKEHRKVSESAFELLKELMDENDERVDRPSFSFSMSTSTVQWT